MKPALLDEPGEDLALALENGWLPIREVARQTGVNAVTLRAWERRYGLVSPLRTDGGHRLYTPQDLQTIQDILLWTGRGMAVGKIGELLAQRQRQAGRLDGRHGFIAELGQGCLHRCGERQRGERGGGGGGGRSHAGL